ncbi:hypothetical protein GCM10009127_01450 [Alteraurantiacibacter aestuarii]
MARDIGAIELRQRSLGDHLERFAGRVRQEVKMQPGHVDKYQHKPRERAADKHGRGFHPHYRLFQAQACGQADVVLDRLGIMGRSFA